MKSENGQSLIEVIVAAAVGILVVTALTFATIFSLRNANFANSSARATKLAEEGLEKVRTLRDRNQDGTVSFDDGSRSANKFSDLWALSLGCGAGINNCYFYFNQSGKLTSGDSGLFESVSDSFKRQLLIEDAGNDQKKITAVVRWTDSSGDHESRLTTILGKL